MTGVAPVKSSHVLNTIKDIFLECLDGDLTQSTKAMWYHLCLIKVGVEVSEGNKSKLKDRATNIQEKNCMTDGWVSYVVAEDEGMGLGGAIPQYGNQVMFMTKDTKS